MLHLQQTVTFTHERRYVQRLDPHEWLVSWSGAGCDIVALVLQPSRPSLLVARWDVGTAADNLASRWHCRCSRPTDRAGITIGEPEHEENCSADPTCAATAWNRTRPVDPRSHRCDCWTASPAAEAATPPGSKHRDAPAVKERERPLRPSCELEKICTQRVHGPPLADFAMRGKGKLCFFALGVSTSDKVISRTCVHHVRRQAL